MSANRSASRSFLRRHASANMQLANGKALRQGELVAAELAQANRDATIFGPGNALHAGHPPRVTEQRGLIRQDSSRLPPLGIGDPDHGVQVAGHAGILDTGAG